MARDTLKLVEHRESFDVTIGRFAVLISVESVSCDPSTESSDGGVQ